MASDLNSRDPADATRWLLPDGIDECLPDEAARLELLRRAALDRFHSWGYELVTPPLVEFVDSLLTGSGRDLDRATVRITDQPSGRMLGVRADITPQVARIDAHRLNRQGPTRLSYAGHVLHARPATMGGSRSPLNIGAELYGDASLASDIEVCSLMLETVSAYGIESLSIDLGNVSIYRQLASAAGLNADQEDQLFSALQRKSVPDIKLLLSQWQVAEPWFERLTALARLNGDIDALSEAEKLLNDVSPQMRQDLADLRSLAETLAARYPQVMLHIDLAELRGYSFHTGLVFAVYGHGVRSELARGGRYDGVGAAFGRARAATGFTADLNRLVAIANVSVELGHRIYAPKPQGADPMLDQAVALQRAAGEQVVYQLADMPTELAAEGCDRQFVNEFNSDRAASDKPITDNPWVVSAL